MVQKTLAILKPDGVEKHVIGKIITRIEQAGFSVVAGKMIKMDRKTAEGFYRDHKGKPFFEPLVEFMTEGPCILCVLQKENAIEDYRELMGNTDPEKAKDGTIRKDFAENIRRNAVHGSDSPQSADREIGFFFSESELL